MMLGIQFFEVNVCGVAGEPVQLNGCDAWNERL